MIQAAFLFTVVGTTGFLGVLAGQLPGDWGFFVPYLIGSISLIVLAVGSTSPGLLQAAIGGFSSFFPDYKERIARHEAAHFLGNIFGNFEKIEPQLMSIWTCILQSLKRNNHLGQHLLNLVVVL